MPIAPGFPNMPATVNFGVRYPAPSNQACLGSVEGYQVGQPHEEKFKNRFGKKSGKLALSDRGLDGLLKELEANGFIKVQARKPLNLTTAEKRRLESP